MLETDMKGDSEQGAGTTFGENGERTTDVRRHAAKDTSGF